MGSAYVVPTVHLGGKAVMVCGGDGVSIHSRHLVFNQVTYLNHHSSLCKAYLNKRLMESYINDVLHNH